MSAVSELPENKRVRSMDNEVRGERADLMFNLVITIPLWALGAGLIVHAKHPLGYTYAALAIVPAIALIVRSVVRLRSMNESRR